MGTRTISGGTSEHTSKVVLQHFEEVEEMNIRRVITVHDHHGKSVIAGEDAVGPITVSLLPGAEFHRIWGIDALPHVPPPTDASPPRDWFPPPGGFRFGLVTLPPDTATMPEGLGMAAALREFEEKLPGMAALMEPDNPGMHTSDTVDVVLIVSGQATIQLDDGIEVVLDVSDCVVQN
ncbi:MAG: hypothetical protein LC808_07595, partial [Actinobacteria bacterium]|nr:hypothetical protein [Actinomycetota bacterium]